MAVPRFQVHLSSHADDGGMFDDFNWDVTPEVTSVPKVLGDYASHPEGKTL